MALPIEAIIDRRWARRLRRFAGGWRMAPAPSAGRSPHEIGHALGLDHTVMSDNRAANTGFSATDVAALQEIWGIA